VEIEFVGAAREVTGSCHILRVAGKTVVLDCGLFQGKRNESHEKNLRLPVPVDQIDAVVLSHAHIDHAGRLPFLVRHGYQGTIWCTPATRDLCAVMLADSAHIQEKDAEFLARRGKESVEPLYAMRHSTRTIELMTAVPYRRAFDVVPGVRVTFIDAGHILGSASVLVDCTEGETTRRFVFSGDIGRSGLPIIRDPEPPDGADVLVMESTYGDRMHEPTEGARARLAAIVRDTAARGGRVLVPAFAVGRTQELVYDLHVLAKAGAIPSMASPMRWTRRALVEPGMLGGEPATMTTRSPLLSLPSSRRRWSTWRTISSVWSTVGTMWVSMPHTTLSQELTDGTGVKASSGTSVR